MEADDKASIPAEAAKRHRSEIEFPYSDLGAAVELAQMIQSKAGASCEPDELAAWMGQTATGGTFRTRVSAARIFGLVDTGGGRIAITQLGRDMLPGSGSERRAKIESFLNAELFRAMYDQYKGNALPPPPAIERHMLQLGVSPKQTERARQTFMKSAVYAGFIDQATGRFVKPGIDARDEAPPAQEKPPALGGGSGGGGESDLDPLIAALIQKLPQKGASWEARERAMWLRMMAMAFNMTYGTEPEIMIGEA